MIIGFPAKDGRISETANFVNCSRATAVKVYRAGQKNAIQNPRRSVQLAINERTELRLQRCGQTNVHANRRSTDNSGKPWGYQKFILNDSAVNSISKRALQYTTD